MWMFDNSTILKDLNSSDKNELEMFCQRQILEVGEVLFDEWDEANSMYILEKWEIEVYKTISWTKQVIWNVKAEDILWEMAIFWLQGKRMASAKVVKKTSLITILYFSIKELTKKNPKILEKIQNIIHIRNIQNKKTV